MKNKMGLAAAFLPLMTFVALAGPNASADDCKACEQYLRFIPEYSLAGSVAAIGTAALHAEGETFSVNQELADALKRQIKEDTRIPEACRQYVADTLHSGPRAEVIVSGSVGANGLGAHPPGFSMSANPPAQLMGMFNALVASYDSCSKLRGKPTFNSCREAMASQSYQKFSNAVTNGSTQEIIKQLGALGQTATSSDVAILKAFTAALNSGNTAALKTWAGGARKSLGTDGFLTAVQMMGWEMNNMYNFNREHSVGTAGQGIVTTDQALASMQNGAAFMVYGPGDTLGNYAVICRDAAVMQAQVLQAGGMPNDFIVAYRSSKGGGHADVITQDPNDPMKLYLLNWFGRSTREGLDGSQALFEGSGIIGSIPDYTQAYVISAPDGHTVADVPSEMGKFLNEVAGGNNAVYDQLNRTNNSIISASMSFDGKGVTEIRGVYGSDGNGATYAGIAGDVHWGEGTHFPGEAGFFAGQQFRPASVYGSSADGTNLIGFAQVVQHAITPELKLGSNAKAVLDTHIAASGTVENTMSGPDVVTGPSGTNLNGDYNHRIGTEVRVDQTALGGKLKAQYLAGGDVMIGQADMRNANSYTVEPLELYLGARATMSMGSVAIFGQAMTVVDQLGARDKVEAGVVSKTLGASVYEAGRITNQTALIQDNSIRRVGVSLQAQPNRWLRLGINGEIPVEGSTALAGARVYGTAAVIF